MRILVLSFYYSPDLSAGSFRTTALASALRERATAGTQIDIVTTLPNRYSSFVQEASEIERAEGLEIRRFRLPAHQSDMLGQARSFASFARQALRYVADRDYDVVYATSGRLLTATLGSWIARRKSAALYLDIRDIFVDTIQDVLPRSFSGLARLAFSGVERFTVRKANRINLVSKGFEAYFRARYGNCPYSWFTNGIDDEFLGTSPTTVPTRDPKAPISIVYAGNIGEGQGLHQILPTMARELGARARFVVIGDGGRREALEAAVAGLDNIVIRKPLPRADLVAAYRSADVLFLHLNAYPAFEKVLPSKLFEYAAVGKPILAGVGGFAAQFVRSEISNSAVFPPCDSSAAIRSLCSLRISDAPRDVFVAKYSRAVIARAMADDVLAVAGERTLRATSSNLVRRD